MINLIMLLLGILIEQASGRIISLISLERVKENNMECDEEEIKATKEKSADELFEELGTNKTDNCDFCVYQGKIYKNGRILFNKLNKNIIFEGFNTIEIKELKAINKKCEELKWI